MKVNELEKIINSAFEDKKNISDTSDKKILDAINETINLTDKGSIRVAEKKNGKWSVNQWVKKAILLSFLSEESDIFCLSSNASLIIFSSSFTFIYLL